MGCFVFEASLQCRQRLVINSGSCMTFFGTVTDVSGEIVEVGERVKKFKVGEKVVIMLNPFVSACFSLF